MALRASPPLAPPLRALVRPPAGYLLRDGVPGQHHGLPGTSLTFVLALDEPLHVGWLGEPRAARRLWSCLSGLHDGPAVISHSGFQHGVQLDLTPSGCRALLGVPAAALRGELATAEDVVGSLGTRLYDAVAGAQDWPERFSALEAELLALLAAHADQGRHRPVDDGVREAWRRLHRDPSTPVEVLADELGWSRRRLHARFVAEVGLAPKQVARVVRFQRSRARLLRGEPLAAVAAATGFSDQPHLTREWRALAGRTPAEWLREERRFVQDGQRADAAPSTS